MQYADVKSLATDRKPGEAGPRNQICTAGIVGFLHRNGSHYRQKTVSGLEPWGQWFPEDKEARQKYRQPTQK